MPETTEKMKPLRRFLENADIRLTKDDKAVRKLTFPVSSELKVERWFGSEVLSHEKGAVRLERARSGAMPLLFNHDINDPIGMIDDARLEGSRLVVDAHLFDTERANEVAAMIDGGLNNVSLMYRSYVIEENTKSETFTVTDWEPLESSIVTIPADPTVGIGRDATTEEFEARISRASPEVVQQAKPAKLEIPMTEKTAAAGDDAEISKRSDGTEMERLRIKTINNLCRQHKVDEKTRDEWIDNGLTVDDVATKVLDLLAERGRTNPQTESKLGLTSKELQGYSLRRAIQACADKNWGKAGFELEASREIAKRLNKIPDEYSFFVPFDVQQRDMPSGQTGKRDLTVATAGAGGYLVETQNLGFIEMMRNRSVAFNMGVRRLSGLQGSVTVPRQSAAATAYWLSTEATSITESQQTFVQMALSPKTAGAYTEISRQLLLQSSPDAEGIVTSDLAAVVALAVDLAVLNGSGASGQPTGIINTAGIGGVTGTSLAYAGVLEFQTDVAGGNVMPGAGGYVTTPAVAALMMQRARFSNTDTPLWLGNIWDGQMSGFRSMSSNQLPSANMLFGDWSQVVVAEWGTLEIAVNPTANFQAGIIGVRAMYSVDVGVRLPAGFSLATSIT